MPQVNEGELLEGLKQLVDLENGFRKVKVNHYIFVLLFCDRRVLGVGASHQYKLLIILSPSGAYYGGETLKPTKIYVEDEYVRAVRGGVGFAKVAGNYAASLLATNQCK